MRLINGWVESIPLTNMRFTNGWVESMPYDHLLIIRLYLYLGGSFMVANGFYILKNDFFKKIDDPFLKDNKDEKRPFYYCIKHVYKGTQLYWMIPLSSRIEKYRRIIEQRVEKHKPVDGLYICKLPNDRESVFLIQDMFPVTAEYIEREYTLGGNHLVLSKETDAKTISDKAKRILNLVVRGIKVTPTSPNIVRILNILSINVFTNNPD